MKDSLIERNMRYVRATRKFVRRRNSDTFVTVVIILLDLSE